MEVMHYGYNNLEKVGEAEKWQIEKEAVDLLTHLVDTPLTEYFGVCRLHRHFDIAEDECVVTSPIENGFYTRVAKLSPEFIPWLWGYNVE